MVGLELPDTLTAPVLLFIDSVLDSMLLDKVLLLAVLGIVMLDDDDSDPDEASVRSSLHQIGANPAHVRIARPGDVACAARSRSRLEWATLRATALISAISTTSTASRRAHGFASAYTSSGKWITSPRQMQRYIMSFGPSGYFSQEDVWLGRNASLMLRASEAQLERDRN